MPKNDQYAARTEGRQIDDPKVLPPAAAPPPALGGTVPGGELAEVPELGLAELGLGSQTPVGLIQNLLEFLHADLGLPWWGAIVAGEGHAGIAGRWASPPGTVAARCLVFPLIVKGQREAAKLNNHLPEITRLTQRMQDAKRSGNQFECPRLYLVFHRTAGDGRPARAQHAERRPGVVRGTERRRPPPRFVDLTAADPLYVLPLVVTGTMWLILEVSLGGCVVV
ncbi:Mitochondrial inner membrane protein OXA1L [Chelonia mydas]|uniref:Mitochondrial inner membrane protein OXA1L n=1 Tax=Chelonia mydas TaxID=8469 RepID=M7B0M4_CHEMY|nr:Mitochondrial inner membrane protein OXA1L [Chelonia mydas]